MRLPAALILYLFSVVAQQALPPPRPVPPGGQPPRDIVRRPEPTGTGVIRGRVVASDTGNPIRRANVSLAPAAPSLSAGATGGRGAGGTATTVLQGPAGSGAPRQASMSLTRPRQATTDAQGAFEFTGLPAGRYRILASPAQYSPQYLGLAYGAKRPSGPFSSDPGQPIQLTDGQTFDKAVIALPRGAVITGRVTDDNADPLARVQVYPVLFPTGSARGQRSGAGGQTDDLGQFRLYGLLPGEYVVIAEARENTFVQPNAPPETEQDKLGFMTTYYPGTTDEAAAQRVRARSGAETSGIEIRMGQGRLFHVSGMVTDSQGRAVARANGQLMRRVLGANSSSAFGFSSDEQGQFQMRNIPPGNYRLFVGQMRPYYGPGGPDPQTDPGEMASLQLTVAGDVDNVLVRTTPGTTITGQIVFEQGPPSPMPGQMRVIASIANQEGMMGMGSPQPALVTPELAFTMKGLIGEYLLRASAPSHYVKSITVNGEDITDTPREFRANDRVTITLTSRVSTLEGIVTDAKGAASTEAGIIVFSEDRVSWRTSSTRTRRSFVDPEGHFRISGLMPGRYFIIAMPRDRLNVTSNGADTAFFEQLSTDAVSVVLGEDEQRRVDLKILESSGGQ